MYFKKMIIYFKEKIKFKIIYIAVCIIFLIALIYLNKTHAFYNKSLELPLFNTKVGNFAGDGESVKQGPIDKNTDVNIIFYTQMPDNPDKYKESKYLPANGYKINDTKSNCYPVNNQESITYQDYTINDDGLVDVTIKEGKPTQVVCRLYYDRDKLSDVVIYAYIQDVNGDKKYNGNNYKLVNNIPSGKTLVAYKCSNGGTNIGYTESEGFKIDTTGPNTCYAYFK